MHYKDDEKLSLSMAAQYIDLPPDTLLTLMNKGWITRVPSPISVPIFQVSDLKKLKAFQQSQKPEIDPKRAEIQVRRTKIQDDLAKLNEDLRTLQVFCKHPFAEKENRGDTGNYDRSQDRYWKDCNCPDCGKRWIEDQ